MMEDISEKEGTFAGIAGGMLSRMCFSAMELIGSRTETFWEDQGHDCSLNRCVT